jgi:hypothetical protein
MASRTVASMHRMVDVIDVVRHATFSTGHHAHSARVHAR